MRIKFKCEFEAEVYQTVKEAKDRIKSLEDAGISDATPFTYINYPGKGEDYLAPGYHRNDVLCYLVVRSMDVVKSEVIEEKDPKKNGTWPFMSDGTIFS